ncbi:MAG: DUF3857 domain-containing protein [Steroidobacteraceae bacterium]
MKRNQTASAAATSLACLMLVARASAGAAVPAPRVNYQILKQSIALHVNADGSYSETVTRVVQPLTIAGVSSVGHVEIAYPANFATVKILAAYTETVTHRRVNVMPSQILNQSTPAAVRAPFLSDGHVTSLLYSGVTPGAEVHLKYIEVFKRPYLPGVYAVSEVLAPQIPVQATDISITAPRRMHLYYHARGPWYETLARNGKMRTLTASATSRSVEFPPMDAAAITQYAPMAVISTAGDWRAIARAYDRLAGDAAGVTPQIRATARKVAEGAGGEVAVARIYHWMQQHVQSVNVDYHHAGLRPPSAQSTLARGLGDSNANVTLLCALLRAQGVAAVPAMISPAARFVPYPGADPFAFNHFLAYVPAYHLFLDTSARYAGIDALPADDQGRPVLITGASPRLTHTPGPPPGLVEAREVQDLTLMANGDINGRSTIVAAGWRAMQVRHDVLGDRRGRRLQRFIENNFYLSGKAGFMRVIAVRNREDLDKPVRIVLRWHDSDAAIPGKRMALLVPTPGLIAATLVPFTSQARRQVPSVLQPVTIEQRMRLRLPPGMRPEQLPRDRHMTTPFGSYRVSYRYADGVLEVNKHLHLTQFVVSTREYPALHKLALIAVSSERKAVLLRRAG